MRPTVTTEAASATRRVWPTTALLVLLAWLLMVYQLLASAFLVYLGFLVPLMGVFLPDTPDSGDFVPAAMAALTTLPAFAAMVWCGWQRGSRLGLLLIGGPAVLLTLVGLNLLDAAPISVRSPQPRGALSPADLFGDLTRVNWIAFVVFAGVAVATHLQRRRARRTQEGSAT